MPGNYTPLQVFCQAVPKWINILRLHVQRQLLYCARGSGMEPWYANSPGVETNFWPLQLLPETQGVHVRVLKRKAQADRFAGEAAYVRAVLPVDQARDPVPGQRLAL